MSRPFYIGAGAQTSGSGNITPPLPSGYIDDDILLLLVDSANEAITAPAGYTEVSNSPQGTGTGAAAGSVRLGVFWKRASGVESAPTVTDTGDHTLGQILLFRGAQATGTPFGAVAGDVEAVASTTVTMPSVTTTVDNSLVILVAGVGYDNAGSPLTTTMTNANLVEVDLAVRSNTATGVGGGFGVWYGLKRTAGATGTTIGSTSPNSVAQGRLTLALNPRVDEVPALIAVSTSISTSTIGISLPLPAGVQTGDLLICVQESANEALAAPTGYTDFTNSPQGTGTAAAAGATRLAASWKVAGPGEAGPTLADAGDHTNAFMLCISGTPTSASPENITAGDVEASSTTAVTFPGLTTTVNDCLILFLHARDTDASGAGLGSYTGGNVAYRQEVFDSGGVAGNGGGLAAIIGPMYSAGAIGSMTATLTAASVQGRLVIALRPASSANTWLPRIIIC